jgi:hypothetical protein
MPFTSPRWRDVYVAAAARAVDQGGTMLAAVTLQITLQQRGHGGPLVPLLRATRFNERAADEAAAGKAGEQGVRRQRAASYGEAAQCADVRP